MILNLVYIQSKVKCRFRKILWPSQNIWTLTDNIFDISDQKSSTSYKPIQNYCQIISELFLRYTCRVWACSKKPCPRWWKISGTQRGVHTLIWRNFCQLHKCGQNLISQIIENYGTVTWSFWLLLLRWSDEKKTHFLDIRKKEWIFFLIFPACFCNPIFFSKLNYNCSNLLDVK